jgi:hypothetical protein
VELCRDQFSALRIPEPACEPEVGSASHSVQTAKTWFELGFDPRDLPIPSFFEEGAVYEKATRLIGMP